MKNDKDNGTEALGAVVPEKKQKVSRSYLTRSFGENIRKLEQEGLVTKEELIKLREIQGEIIKKLVTTGI